MLIPTYIGFALFISVINGIQTYHNLRPGLNADHYQQGGAWLEANANAGDIVFHSDWADFPMLFFQTSKVRYISGLDPTFLYKQSPELYDQWERISSGEQKEHLHETITQVFQAQFVVASAHHTDMRREFQESPDFEEVYTDDTLSIFKIPPFTGHH